MVLACSARWTLTSFCFLLVQTFAHLGATNTLSCMKLKEKKIALISFCNHGIFLLCTFLFQSMLVPMVFMVTEWIHECAGELSSQYGTFRCGAHRMGWIVRSLTTRASFLRWFSTGLPQRPEYSAVIAWEGDPAQPDDSVIFLDELMALCLLFKNQCQFYLSKSSLSWKTVDSSLFPCTL